MSLNEELSTSVKNFFKEQWAKRDGKVVPTSVDLKLSNDAVELDGVVLYADLTESTKLVDSRLASFAAEIYKSYLYCAAKLILAEGGEITAYDGDRIMAVFLGDRKRNNATRAALKINYARLHIINPAIKKQYPNESYIVEHTIGLDSSKLFVARTGVRGSNDLVWVGKSANHAAKLCGLKNLNPIRITYDIYNYLDDEHKLASGINMWGKVPWTEMGREIYHSSYYWKMV